MKKNANEGVAPTMGGAPEDVANNDVANEVLSMIRGASAAKLRLFIKGTPQQAEEALAAHGITEFELFNYGDYNTCQYDVMTDWNTASSWLGENPGVKPESGTGYAPGTLLYYNELNGADPKMEATGSKDTKVGPLKSLSSDTSTLDDDIFMTDEEKAELEEEKERERFHPEDEPNSIMDSASGGNRGFQSNGPFIGAPGLPGQFASKKTAGFSTRDGNKSEVQEIYNSLTLVSTNDQAFRKPSFMKINDEISIGDNGSVTVFSGSYQGHPFGPNDYINAEDAGMWYELEGVSEDLFNKQGSLKKKAGSPGDPDGDGVVNMDDYTCDMCGVRSGDYHDPQYPGFAYVNGGSWCGKCWAEMGKMGVTPYGRASKKTAAWTDARGQQIFPGCFVTREDGEDFGGITGLAIVSESGHEGDLIQVQYIDFKELVSPKSLISYPGAGRASFDSEGNPISDGDKCRLSDGNSLEDGEIQGSTSESGQIGVSWNGGLGRIEYVDPKSLIKTGGLNTRVAAPSALREIKPGDKCLYTNSEGKVFHVTIVNAPSASDDYGTIVGVQGLPEEGWAEGDWDNVVLMSLRLDPDQNELIGA